MLKDPWLKALVVLLAIIAGIYLIGLVWTIVLQFADIVLMLVLAWLISFVLEPVVQILLVNTRLVRPLAVALVYLGLLIVLSLAVILIVPVVALQTSQIGTNLPSYADSVEQWVKDVDASLPRQGLVGTAVANFDYTQFGRSVEAIGPAIVNNALALAAGLASLLFNLVLVMMFSFYIMLDGGKLTGGLSGILPTDRRDEFTYLIFSLHRAFGGFLRGQLIQASVCAAGTALVMVLANLSYTAVVAIYTFGIMMVPFVGPILALIPPLAISLFVHPESAWWVFLLLLGLQQVVLNVLAPRVMSRIVGVHPLVVLLALLIGAKLAGAWGALFAVPVAGTVVAMIAFYRMSIDERAKHATQAVTEGFSNGQGDLTSE